MTTPTAGTDRPLKEHGLLFNTAMVRALLAGTKTQTRRAVRTGDVGFIGGCDDDHDDPDAWGFADGDGCLHVLDQSKPGWYYIDCDEGGSVPVSRMRDGTAYLGNWAPPSAAERPR